MVRRLGTVLLLALFGTAAAQCSIAAGSELDNLTLEGFGSAYFENLRFDQAADEAEFYGRVCIAGVGWTLLTERVVLTGLSSELHFSAFEPELHTPNLTVTGLELNATEEVMILTDVVLVGQELSGSADRLEFDLASNVLTLTSPVLQGRSLLAIGERATLDGSELSISQAIVTTCLCSDAPLYTVRGSRVGFDLITEIFTVAEGSIHIGPLTLELAAELEVDPEDFDQLEVPFSITFEPDLPGDAGEGLGFELPNLDLARDISVQLDLAGLDGGHPLSGTALLRGRQRGVRFDIGVVDGGVSSEIVIAKRLLPWLEAHFEVRNFDREAADRLHEGLLGLTAAVALPISPPLGSLGVEAHTFAAASSQTPARDTVSGARLGARLGASYLAPTTRFGRGALEVQVEATLYPDADARQFAARIAPSWTVVAGPLALELGYLRLWSDEGSPFSTRLDLLEPQSRLAAELDLATVLAGLEVAAGIDLGYDLLDPGWSRLRGSGALGLALDTSDRLELTVEADLLGLLSDDEDDEAWFEAGVGWSRQLGGGMAELAVRLHSDVETAPAALSWIDVSAAYPFVGDGALLTPYLAFDLAPLLRGRGPLLSGHGLDLMWYSCCGTLLLGYRFDRQGFSTTLGVRLDLSDPSGTIRPVNTAQP